jgi:hypothetical protein
MARRVAARMSSTNPTIGPLVESELRGRAKDKADDFSADWMSLAQLLLAVVSTVYPIIKDRADAKREDMRQRAAAALDGRGIPASARRSTIVEALLDEIAGRRPSKPDP